MGQLADALRANLKAVAASDARALREIDQELKAATAQVASPAPALSGQIDTKALLGQGRFQQQTVATLRQLCKQHGIKGVSKLKKLESVGCARTPEEWTMTSRVIIFSCFILFFCPFEYRDCLHKNQGGIHLDFATIRTRLAHF